MMLPLTYSFDMSTVLHLTLKREWFDKIAAGTKTEEFRDQSPHWNRLLGPHVGNPPWTEIHFRNGYRSTSPFIPRRYEIIHSKKVVRVRMNVELTVSELKEILASLE